jgi:hypothetical protein
VTIRGVEHTTQVLQRAVRAGGDCAIEDLWVAKCIRSATSVSAYRFLGLSDKDPRFGDACNVLRPQQWLSNIVSGLLCCIAEAVNGISASRVDVGRPDLSSWLGGVYSYSNFYVPGGSSYSLQHNKCPEMLY